MDLDSIAACKNRWKLILDTYDSEVFQRLREVFGPGNLDRGVMMVRNRVVACYEACKTCFTSILFDPRHFEDVLATPKSFFFDCPVTLNANVEQMTRISPRDFQFICSQYYLSDSVVFYYGQDDRDQDLTLLLKFGRQAFQTSAENAVQWWQAWYLLNAEKRGIHLGHDPEYWKKCHANALTVTMKQWIETYMKKEHRFLINLVLYQNIVSELCAPQDMTSFYMWNQPIEAVRKLWNQYLLDNSWHNRINHLFM